MTKEIKLEEKELKEIKELNEDKSKLTFEFGNLRMELILVRAKLMELEKIDSDMEAKFKGSESKISKVMEKLRKKYGDGRINLSKGTFTQS